MHSDGLVQPGCHGIHSMTEEIKVAQWDKSPANGYSGKYFDDVSGQVLKAELVMRARADELKYFNDKGVWLKVPMKMARLKTGRAPISVRWVDTNKGDDLNPNYRSRLVARQIKARDKSGENFFAPAPPIGGAQDHY